MSATVLPASEEVAFVPDARFELRRRLGRGAFGEVYEAFDHERSVPLAIKRLLALDAADLLRFKQEFRALCDIVHPNLLALHDLFFSEGVAYFTMDFIDGQDFLSFVRPSVAAAKAETLAWSKFANDDFVVGSEITNVTVDEGRLRDALSQLLRGVCALHAAGKLHRDLKPSTVLSVEKWL